MDDVICKTLPQLINNHLVVELAVVLVAVSVYGAEEPGAPTGEASQPHLLLAHAAPVLLLLPVAAAALVPGGPAGGGADLRALDSLGLRLRPHTGHRGLGGLQGGGRGGGLLLVTQTLETRASAGA